MNRRNILKALFGSFFLPRDSLSNITPKVEMIAGESVFLKAVKMEPYRISIDRDMIQRAMNTALVQSGYKIADINTIEYIEDFLILKENNMLEQQYEYRL